MEVKINKNGELIVKHKLKRNETYKVSKTASFQTISIYRKPQQVKGFSNCTEFSRYIFTGDYDNVNKDIVLEDAEYLQQKYDLPLFYLFTTKEEIVLGEKRGNYHLVNLAIHSYEDIKEIIKEIRGDEKYKTMNTRSPYRSWILRLSGKGKRGRPRFVGVVGELENLDRKISLAHLELISKLYKIPEIEYSKNDGGRIVKMQIYETKG